MAPDEIMPGEPRFSIPQSFRLAGTLWTVIVTEDISEMGHCDGGRAIIRVNAALPDQVQEATFFHELMHAVFYMAGVPLGDHVERDIDAFGNLLHQFHLTRD